MHLYTPPKKIGADPQIKLKEIQNLRREKKFQKKSLYFIENFETLSEISQNFHLPDI